MPLHYPHPCDISYLKRDGQLPNYYQIWDEEQREAEQQISISTCEQWFKPYSPRRRYCQLPVSGRRIQRFLQFRLGCHGLPIASGRLAGAGHVTGLTGFVWLATVVLLVMKSI